MSARRYLKRLVIVRPNPLPHTKIWHRQDLDNWVQESDPLNCCSCWLAESRRPWWRMIHGLSLPHILMVGCRVMLLVPGGLPQAVGFTSCFPRGPYPAVSPCETTGGNICLWDLSLHIRVYSLLTQALTAFAVPWTTSGNWPLHNKALSKLKKKKKLSCSLPWNHT